MCVLLFIEDFAKKGIAFFIDGNLLLYHIFSGGIRVIIDQTQEKNAPVALGPLGDLEFLCQLCEAYFLFCFAQFLLFIRCSSCDFFIYMVFFLWSSYL